jgi:hypothetical protein
MPSRELNVKVTVQSSQASKAFTGGAHVRKQSTTECIQIHYVQINTVCVQTQCAYLSHVQLNQGATRGGNVHQGWFICHCISLCLKTPVCQQPSHPKCSDAWHMHHGMYTDAHQYT